MILNYSNLHAAADASRASAHAVTVSDNRIYCRVLNRFIMALDARDTGQTPYLAMDGILDPRISEVLCDAVKPGMICCDVGACFGYHTLLMAETAGIRGFVHAFECNPRVFVLLKQNIEMADLVGRVSLSQEAVGAAAGVGSLLMHRRRFGAATLAPAMQSSFGDGERRDVAITTLDTRLLSRGIVPDFYLIACSGYEDSVWAGMKGLLREKRSVQALIENYPKFQDDPKKFGQEILDQGFSVRRVDQDHLTPLYEAEQFAVRFRQWLLLSR